MRKTVASLSILAVIILIALSAFPVAAADHGQEAKANKISSRLALQVSTKIKQTKGHSLTPSNGLVASGPLRPLAENLSPLQSTGNLENQQIFIYFEEAPDPTQIAELEALSVTVYPETWTPPLANHPNGFLQADMPVDKLTDVAAIASVVCIDTAERLSEPLSDLAAIATNADDAWDLGYDGAGITIAVLDSGFEIDHPDFPTMTPGVDYRDFSHAKTGDDDYDVANRTSGHGTHVAGTALGRGTASSEIYQGSAHGATPKFLKIGGDISSGATDAAIVDAIHAAVNDYDADVITISYGGWGTYHDGSEATCQAVDWAVDQGTAVFLSSGNFAQDGHHYSGMAPAAGFSDWIAVNVDSIYLPTDPNPPEEAYALFYNMIWFDGAENNNLELHLYYPNQSEVESMFIHPATQEESPRGTESRLSGLGTNSEGLRWGVPPGTWYLRVENHSTNDQFFHLYDEYRYNNVTFANADPFYTIGDAATADGAIAVGAYTTRSTWWSYENNEAYFNPQPTPDEIAYFSSRGPRVDGMNKPEVVAPGSAIISCRDDDVYPWEGRTAAFIDNDGPNQDSTSRNNATTGEEARYYVMHGTSMACPHAAGIGALLLQKNPALTPEALRSVLQNSATDKGASGRDDTYGWGLINAEAALAIVEQGDADSDGVVDSDDFAILSVAFMTATGETDFDERADFNNDGIVNISDFGLLAANFGKGSPY